MKMLSVGGQVPTHTLAPASASAFATANPYPPSSATPATSARRPVRSMFNIRGICAFQTRAARGVMLAFRSMDNSRRFRKYNGAQVSRLIQAVLCASLLAGGVAGAQPADTISGPKPLFTLRDVLMAGGFTLATIGLAPAD